MIRDGREDLGADRAGRRGAHGRVADQAGRSQKIIKTGENEEPIYWHVWPNGSGFALWLAYGVMLGQWPLIATPASGKRAVADTLLQTGSERTRAAIDRDCLASAQTQTDDSSMPRPA